MIPRRTWASILLLVFLAGVAVTWADVVKHIPPAAKGEAPDGGPPAVRGAGGGAGAGPG